MLMRQQYAVLHGSRYVYEHIYSSQALAPAKLQCCCALEHALLALAAAIHVVCAGRNTSSECSHFGLHNDAQQQLF